MALIKTITPPSEADLLRDVASQCTQIMKNAARASWEILWHSKDKSAQQIIDDLGDDAGAALQAHSDLQDLISSVDSSYVRLVPVKAISVVDGKIVVAA